MPNPTHSRFRWLRVACALGLAAGLLVTMAPTPAGAQPVATHCSSHADAGASVWLPWVCQNDKERHKICKAIGKQCKKAVKSAHKCITVQVKGELDVSKAECQFSNVDTKACKNVVKGLLQDQIDTNNENKASALGQCEVQTAQCIATCHL